MRRRDERESLKSTDELLVDAAAREFDEVGYATTNTNRIARRAGFAPQTFYRNFPDKLAIFLRVYERWQNDERRAAAAALAAAGESPDTRIARVLLAAHRDSRMLRRALRTLAVEEDRVRDARARGRSAQITDLLRASGAKEIRVTARHLAALLTVERLCDAAADDEPRDLGIADAAWVEVVAEAVGRLREETGAPRPGRRRRTCSP